MEEGDRLAMRGWKPRNTQDVHMREYVLYEWLGKLRWCYLYGVYLVDPKYEQEFVKEHRVH